MRTAALLLLLLSAPAAAPAQPAPGGGPVTLAVTPPDGKVGLAEAFEFRVEASMPEGYTLRPDTAAASNSEFQVTRFAGKGAKSAAGRRTETFEVEAKAFTLGVSTFPALAWQLAGPGAAAGAVVKSEPFNLEVLPAFEIKEGEDIKDIYGPYGYFPWRLALLLAALAALAFYLYRRFSGGKTPLFSRAPWHDARSPYQRARERLDRLAGCPLAQNGRMKEYYTGLAAVLRFYLDEEFAMETARMTTADLGRELKRTGAELKTLMKARDLLHKADLVKFARLKPADPAADADALRELLAEFHAAAEQARALKAAAEAAAAEQARRRGGRP